MSDWKYIEGFENEYRIYKSGKVWSEKSNLFLSFQIVRGYYSVFFSTHSVMKGFRVHRLLAQAFIPNPLNKPHVNHIDGDRLNNALPNLEWCTREENMYHARHVLKRNMGNHNPVITKVMVDRIANLYKGKPRHLHSRARKVDVYEDNGKFIKQCGCILDVAADFNIHKDNVLKVLKGKKLKSKGYIFKYSIS